MHLVFSCKQTKVKVPNSAKLLIGAWERPRSSDVSVCAFMRTMRPCQRSAYRQVFELLHHLVLLLREHEFCFTLLSK